MCAWVRAGVSGAAACKSIDATEIASLYHCSKKPCPRCPKGVWEDVASDAPHLVVPQVGLAELDIRITANVDERPRRAPRQDFREHNNTAHESIIR